MGGRDQQCVYQAPQEILIFSKLEFEKHRPKTHKFCVWPTLPVEYSVAQEEGIYVAVSLYCMIIGNSTELCSVERPSVDWP